LDWSNTDIYASRKKFPLTTPELLEQVDKIHKIVKLKTVKLTGGEPLLNRDLPNLIRKLKGLGNFRIHLTTNGYLLKELAFPLLKAGVDTINVSVDTLNSKTFHKINKKKGSIKKILNGIELAKKLGIKIKINCTVMRNYNHHQIKEIFDFFSRQGITVRFLELMDMGPLYDKAEVYFFSQEEILQSLGPASHFEIKKRKKSSTANYWITKDFREFGIIANKSWPFCSDCDRLRMDSSGKIFGCLSDSRGFDIRNIHTQKSVKSVLQQALAQKQSEKFQGSRLSMRHIGG
jgi:cyclic pyranopterin phosphate synthase